MPDIRKLISPNFDERAAGAKPAILILHYTGTATGLEAEAVYLDPRPPKKKSKGPVSPHYMIDRDGLITQFVDEQKRAWHAGHSWWDGRGDINSHSIGIELVNPGHKYGYLDFTKPQMESLALLVRDILSRHDIPPHYILGHSDIAPATEREKPDPGEKMAWAWLAANGIGLWPDPQQEDYDQSQPLLADSASLRQALTDYGYDPRVTDEEVIKAFQRHFQPEAYAQNRPGISDRETTARLHWLLHRKNAFKS
jgi:N-acetylmuramoyl-L-alanine amidase